MTTVSNLEWIKNPFRELVRLAWPICVSMVSYSAMTLSGTLFVGRLGASALAGVGLGGVAAFTSICFAFGVLRAVKVLVSQAIGAGRRERLSAYVGAGAVSALALGAISVGCGPLLSSSLPRLSAAPEAGRLAAEYFEIRNFGAPLALLSLALREARYGLGDARSPMLVSVVANLLNIALDAIFIFGLGLGVAGAAWSTVIAHAVEALLMLYVQRNDGLGLSAVRLVDLHAVVRLGWPLGLQFLLEVGSFAVLVAILARIGQVDLAAHQIALQLCHFSFLPAFALGEAASVLSGQAVGADRDALVRRIGRLALGIASVYTGACALAFALGAPLLAAAFTSDTAVIRLATRLIWVAAAFQLFDGANVVARSVLRGTGDVRYPAMISVVIAWITTPPLTALLGIGLGLGALGGWLGICLETIVGASLLWWRLEREHWQKAAVRSRAELASDAADRKRVTEPIVT